jgi:hypothetical protein
MNLRTPVTERDLARELDDLRDRHPVLKDDELFALWFLLAFVTDDEKRARSALTGGANDQGIDALLIHQHPDAVQSLFELRPESDPAGRIRHRAAVARNCRCAVDEGRRAP